VFDRRPEIVVMRPFYFGERAATHALALRRLHRGGYQLRGRYPLGDLLIDVYAAPATAPRPASSPS
jgi:hypothetical protein